MTQAIETWVHWRKACGVKESTLRTQMSVLRRLAAATDLDSATTDDLAGWVARHDWQRETRRVAVNSIRSYYKWLALTGRRTDNPAAALALCKPPPPRPRPVTEDMLSHAMEHAPDEQTRLMVLLAAYAGLRRAEIAGLHTNDLDGDCLRVIGKGDRPRTVPIGGELLQALRRCPPGWIFPGRWPGTHVEVSYVGKRLAALLPTGYTGHKLRHRYASRIYCRTNDLLAVQELLGHASPVTTRRYIETDLDRLRAVAAAAL